ncbi:MAG: NAD(P)/FAD-dependent oxidoreductase [Crocinitomicaceae bacterium]
MLSFWESESFTKYDVAIIGAGITGLSVAIELKAKQPELEVIILERGLVPTGASTKNAGFACVGSLTEILDDLKTMSSNEVVDLIQMRKDGLQILRDRLGDQNIDYLENGSYELCLQETDFTSDIKLVNELIFPVFKRPVFKLTNKVFGFGSEVKTVIESTAEGQINTGKMLKSLLKKALTLGVEVKTGYSVNNLITKQDSVRIENDILPIIAKQVCVCTNAFAKSLIPEIKLQPGRGQVLITKPIKNLPFKGIYHFDEGYYYFRTIADRVLFGGGRQLDFEGETSDKFKLNEFIQKDLEKKMKTIILPGIKFEIDKRWTGIMAFGENKKPIIKQVDGRVFAAVRFGGMGIAIGSKAAELVADLMISSRDL